MNNLRCVTLYLTIDCDHVLVLVWLGDNNARWSLETAAAALALNYFHITTPRQDQGTFRWQKFHSRPSTKISQTAKVTNRIL